MMDGDDDQDDWNEPIDDEYLDEPSRECEDCDGTGYDPDDVLGDRHCQQCGGTGEV